MEGDPDRARALLLAANARPITLRRAAFHVTPRGASLAPIYWR